MAWPTREQRQAVATLDETLEAPEPALTKSEAQTIEMLLAQAEARMLHSQRVQDARARKQAEEDARIAADQQELNDAAAEIQRLKALQLAEAQKAEQNRVAKILSEYEATGALRRIAQNAVRAYEAQSTHTDPIEAARAVFTQRLGVDAPPYELWVCTGLNCEVWLSDLHFAIDLRPGLDAPAVTLYGTKDVLPVVSALEVIEAATLGRYLSEYKEAAPIFGLNPDETAEAPKLTSDFDLSDFGAQR